ncbi:MAG: aspartate/glutamate racemase family protein [Devosia sp.]
MTNVRIITPIISAGFRDDTPLAGAVPQGCNLSSVFLTNGPESVESAIDEVMAAPGVVDATLQAQADGVEAIVIDCMLDPGIDAAREAVVIPVIGCGEAGLKAAAAFGKFSIVTVLDRQARAFRELAARHGLADRLVSVRAIGVTVLDLERDRAGSIAATIEQSRLAVEEDGARAVVFGCTGMLGFAEPVLIALGDAIDGVIDPLPHAVALAHKAAFSGEKIDKALYPHPDRKNFNGFAAWTAMSDHLKAKP